ncbi:VWFA and cache domain-containing protein 1 isoform X2 [Cherax quadricarinatus]|uniref:VWFA and cache domain-containing protein 1 isoform X2 n=1 Tax=Cherax quadricarinatus TaxID=27406 RepID=UPI00387E9EF2
MRSHIHGVRSGQSMVALLTTLSPLAVSLLLWVSQSVAQENISNAINNNSSATTVSLGQRDNASVNNSDVKPVIYVDNPQHLRELQEQSFLRHSLRLSPGRSTDGKDGNVLGVSLLEQAATLGSQLRHIANNELGVTHMQATFDELPYSDLERREEDTVKEMIQSLERKFTVFSSLIEEMSKLVANFYSEHRERELEDVMHYADEHKYHPCCLIPDNYLEYRSHFGTRVNEDLCCDSGFGSGDHPLPEDFYAAPDNLREMFIMNLRRYPTIKWQYFMSVNGLHTEYPAHRPGTSIGADCGQSSRHRHVYEATVRSSGWNIVLLYDLGESLTPRLLLTAKAIGHQIISTLQQRDNIAVLGVAKSIFHPSASCLRSTLVSATHDVKESIREFVDYMEIENERTNHSLGLLSALDVIASSSLSLSSQNASVLLVYMSRGVLETVRQTRLVMKRVAERIESINTRVVISTFGLGLVSDEPSLAKKFLEDLAYQNFDKYNIQFSKVGNQGTLVLLDSTLSVAPLINNFYNVVQEPKAYNHSPWDLVISEPYWDDDGKETVVSLTRSVHTDEGKIVGVIGIDVPLANLLEDITHFNSPAQSYAFAIDSRGNVLGHPKLGRPETWTLPLIPTDITLLEQVPGFSSVRDDLINLSSGHRYLTENSEDGSRKDELHYWWCHSLSCGWVFVVAWLDSGLPHKRLSRNIRPLPPTALFHRLDLLSPSEARVCRHFNQMATLDGSTVFLSVGSYVSPLSQIANGPETLGAVQSITAYLSDSTQLIANPGLRMGVRTDATALYQITELWKTQFHNSELSKYIVRRYVATPSGVTLMYPGTLLDRTYDPRSQAWYLGALSTPGRVVVSAPYLDPGGAGYIVTVSHTVYQGRSAAMHSPADPVVAVLATDFTLGYWYKLLLDLNPSCGNYGALGKASNVRCFLMNNEGYLVAHPSLLAPSASPNLGADIPPHITHQEPVVSMELLAGGGGLLSKTSCGRWWHGASERHYSLRLPTGQVVASSGPETGQVDNSCLRYTLTSVPATNLILGIINQTCSPSVAFCPCSMDDRLCLNCQLVEAGACECPCECPLLSRPCAASVLDLSSATTQSSAFMDSLSNYTSDSFSQHWQPYFDAGFMKGQLMPQVLELATQSPDTAPTCGRTPEAAMPLQYSIGLLSHLDTCLSLSCATQMTHSSCLGVVGCIWCSLTSDRQSRMAHPHCTEVHQCYGGVLGGPSPYPHGLATLPHSDNTHGASGNPIGPVAGGIMAVFMVVAVAVYCYRQHVGGGSSRSFYTPANFQSQPHQHPLYQSQPTHQLDNGDEDLLGDMSGVGLGAAATVSPYRMNPGYRRPPGLADSSDQGYSTMTPHDDSENLNYNDLGGIVGLPINHMVEDFHSSSGWSPPSSPVPQERESDGLDNHNHYEPSHTLLANIKRSGPNIIQVPVTVHMVDTV